ncbi:peptide-methionine (S)-S-oxide reductase [Alkalicella caledoniensis]|uniref:peptide-methionine (S)-S-oxide reductase n=1 Tax=Alkalicella caledoniensis TaxID=2731377 RepID=A0A7G9WBH1_ALKCA|nr:peptide-methionine (S)-S-oxide reductase [Alkalicella caledoniensis]
MRTKVGYGGGKKENPTYEDLGDHTETLQVEFDPSMISYEELLKNFFSFHNPTRQAFSRQYMSVIFYHDDIQKDTAIATRDAFEQEKNIEIITDIVPFTNFYLAEFYHQKYYLQANGEAMDYLKDIFKTLQEFLDSPAITKINGEAPYSEREGELMERIKRIINS